MSLGDDRILVMPPGLWYCQWLHAGGLLVLLVAISIAFVRLDEPSPMLFWIAVAVPIVHQVFVWLAWRLELRSMVTRKVIGFRGYLVIFFVLFGGRFVTLLALAWADRGSLHLAVLPRVALTGLLTLLGVYAMYSVMRYFGLARAAGGDHFDPAYRDMPLVKEGVFRYTRNGMYLYAFLLFWAIAVAFDSRAALAVAAFSHAYIWIHFYATEEPDMRFIYAAAAGDDCD
jgi:protein-S-isoprenylcysteine O-methyltransferase Ste14